MTLQSELFCVMATSHAEPVFLLRRSLPQVATTGSDTATGSTDRVSALGIWLAAQETSEMETIPGAQDIKGLWRIYLQTCSDRDKPFIGESVGEATPRLMLYDKTRYFEGSRRHAVSIHQTLDFRNSDLLW